VGRYDIVVRENLRLFHLFSMELLGGTALERSGGKRRARLRALGWARTYEYGTIARMKKTLHIDAKLLSDARAVSGAATDTEAVRLGLEALVRRAAYERLRALRGTASSAAKSPRRREKRSSKRRAT
jgi:hypothetical protein